MSANGERVDLLTRICYTDLNEDMQMLADIIGVESTIRLMTALGGEQIRFQKVANAQGALRKFIEEGLRLGLSVRKIARLAGVSDSKIRCVMKTSYNDKCGA